MLPLLSLVPVAFAADVDGSLATNIDLPQIPSTPAFDALGVSPTSILRPATTSTIGADLLTMVNDDGSLRTGFAMEVAPIWLVSGRKLTLAEWRTSPAQQIASRTTLAIATAPGESGGTTVAESLTIVWADKGDPRHDKELSRCLTVALQSGAGDPTAPPTLPADEEIVTPVDDPTLGACKAESAKRMANRFSVASAAAITQVESGIGLDHEVGFGSLQGWTSVAVPIGNEKTKVGQVVLATHYETADFETHEVATGARLRLGGQEVSLAGDFLWSPQFSPLANSLARFQGAAVGELPLSDQITLGATVGSEFGPDMAEPDLKSLLVIKTGGRSIALPVF